MSWVTLTVMQVYTVPVTEIEPCICHNCITPVYHSVLRFFSLCCCVSWDVAQEIWLHSDENFLSGGVLKEPHASGPVPVWRE